MPVPKGTRSTQERARTWVYWTRGSRILARCPSKGGWQPEIPGEEY